MTDKLLTSFKTLCSLATQINFLIEAHETLMDNEGQLKNLKFKGHYSNLPFPNSISGVMLNYSLIVACSFLDEFKNEFNSHKNPEYASRINKLKKITKPVIVRISHWKDLKDLRNNILAHNWRKKGGDSLLSFSKELHSYNAPHTNSEIVFLSKLLPIITNCIGMEFPDLLEKLDFSETLTNKLKYNYQEINIEEEIVKMWDEVNLIKSNI